LYKRDGFERKGEVLGKGYGLGKDAGERFWVREKGEHPIEGTPEINLGWSKRGGGEKVVKLTILGAGRMGGQEAYSKKEKKEIGGGGKTSIRLGGDLQFFKGKKKREHQEFGQFSKESRKKKDKKCLGGEGKGM